MDDSLAYRVQLYTVIFLQLIRQILFVMYTAMILPLTAFDEVELFWIFVKHFLEQRAFGALAEHNPYNVKERDRCTYYNSTCWLSVRISVAQKDHQLAFLRHFKPKFHHPHRRSYLFS